MNQKKEFLIKLY